jgi:PGF-pre-PGF domain-containing protein
MRKNLRFFGFGILILLIIILGAWFVMATAFAPTGVYFSNNVTPLYDEGIFNLNWSSGGPETDSYMIYMSNDGGVSFYLGDVNNSVTGYSFVITSDANYTFIVEAINATGNANSTLYNMSVDRTGPVITLPEYTNATAKKNTDQLTLNISVSDAKSGLTGSLCIVDVNGTNQTLTQSSGWCNSSSVDLTNLADGNKVINVWVNDTVNIFGLNNSFFVAADTTAPTVSLTKTSSGQTSLTISISGAEGTCTSNRTGASISGSTLTETGLSCGTSYVYTVTCTDSTGNSGTSVASSFPTTGCSSGGGGGGSQPPKNAQSWSKITPGVVTIMKNFDPEIGLKQIQIEVNNTAQNVKITVTKYDGEPAEVSVEKSGKVYQYIEIDPQNLGDELSKAKVQFRVGKSWISNNGLDKANIAAFKFDETNDEWDELITTYNGSEGDDELYEVELTSFSFFAISEKTSVEAGEEAAEETVVGTGEEQKRNLTWLWVLLAVIILIGMGWKLRKRR